MVVFSLDIEESYTRTNTPTRYHRTPYTLIGKKMDRVSSEILHLIKENEENLIDLCIGDGITYHKDGIFNSSNGSDFTTLGQYIAKNTYITNLEVNIDNIDANITTNRGFYNGIKNNSSITSLSIRYNSLLHNADNTVADEILQACQENKNFTRLDITCYHLNSANDLQQNEIYATLRRCTNLRQITLYACNITDEHFLPMVEAMREHNSVEELCLPANLIGNTGCQSLATLLEDSRYNLKNLDLSGNEINIVGLTALTNALSNNTKLKKLNLNNNQIDQSMIGDSFCKLLCNNSSVNNTYSSNHTLEEVQGCDRWGEVASLLGCNRYMKEYAAAAINKILRYHPNIDMEPFFEMGTEDSERDLQGLPL